MNHRVASQGHQTEGKEPPERPPEGLHLSRRAQGSRHMSAHKTLAPLLAAPCPASPAWAPRVPTLPQPGNHPVVATVVHQAHDHAGHLAVP